jgi:hypothetical protein
MKRERKGIPSKVKRQLLVECGYRCSVPHCHNDSALDFHHIDGNPANNSPDNLIVFCSNHHRLASIGKIDVLACKEIKKALRAKLITYHTNQDIVRKMRRVIQEEFHKAHDATRTQKSFSTNKTILFRRKQLFELLEDDLPNVYLAVAVLGELKTPGGVSRIIKAVDKIRHEIRPQKKPKPLSLAARVYKIAIWAFVRYETRTAIKWLADQFSKLPPEFELIENLLLALNSSRKAKQYVGFQILKISSGRKEEFLEITYTLYGRRYQMRMEVVGSTKKKRKRR